jgi:hypothetical protein
MRPGEQPVNDDEFSFDPDIPGDSHLAICPPAIRHDGTGPPPDSILIEVQTEAGAWRLLEDRTPAVFSTGSRPVSKLTRCSMLSIALTGC